MSAVKHTPGPWTVMESVPSDGVNCFFINAADGMQIGCADGYQSEPMREANARLIAAAPDMLKALQWIVDWSFDAPDLREKARAAIAKATGEAA